MTRRYGVFSDESRITASRFRSIAALSLPAERVVEINEALRAVFLDSDVREFKWSKFQGGRSRHCAIKMIDFLIDAVLPAEGRADVLVWDTHDQRHTVPNRDDTKNFERMFFHLHRALMERRELGAEWHLRPDERVDIDWDTVRACLSSVGAWQRYFEDPLLEESFSERFFEVQSLDEVDSAETPLCQLADLLAGLAPYTRESNAKVKAFMAQADGQLSMLAETSDDVLSTLSQRDRDRLIVVHHLNRRCKERRLGVSLRTEGFFSTPDPRRPINFWHYMPQTDKDRAPVRDG